MAHSAAYYTSLAHKYMCFNTYMHPTACSYIYIYLHIGRTEGVGSAGFERVKDVETMRRYR